MMLSAGEMAARLIARFEAEGAFIARYEDVEALCEADDSEIDDILWQRASIARIELNDAEFMVDRDPEFESVEESD